MTKLTTSFVDNLPARETRYDIMDSVVRGFGVRVNRGCKTYFVRSANNAADGGRVRYKIGHASKRLSAGRARKVALRVHAALQDPDLWMKAAKKALAS